MAMNTERIITLAMGALATGGLGSGIYQNQNPPPCECEIAVAACEQRNDEDCRQREREIRDFCFEKLRAGP
jgi:hypothetical protein